jgi:hypothetical protein
MSNPADHEYESTYRNTPFAAFGLLTVGAAGGASAIAAFHFLPADDILLAAAEIALATIVLIAGVGFAAFSRHRWRAGGEGLHIQETWRVPLPGGARQTLIPYDQVLALRRVESGFDVLLEIETGSGARYVLMPGSVRDKAGAVRPDHAGFDAFANALRSRISAAQPSGVTFTDGLGFWNKGIGLVVLCCVTILTAGLSALILIALLTGVELPQGAALQGLAIVLVLPAFAAYALYRSWARRSFVLSLHALRDQMRAKP